ncbi:MAG: sugar ABC transporter permease [Pseudomonadota bacterium]
MKHRTFFWFFLPTGLAMVLFIFLPIISVVTQSLYVDHEQVIRQVENCDIFGCKKETVVDTEATEKLRAEQPLGRFVGLANYFNRSHLASSEVAAAWSSAAGFGDFFNQLFNLPFYKALMFTLTYTFVVTPLLIILGFIIAIAVNALNQQLKGIVIFFSLLPMIVTPLVGSLILFWMIDARGILGSTLQDLAGDPNLSLKASTTLTWITLMVYGVWNSAPFAFVVFYAGLQTLPQDTLESAMIDGATRWQRIRYVVIPHLAPLVTFVALIQLMDNFRVFEPIVGFNAEAHATSLSWIIYNDLSSEIPLLSSAATTSVLTILGVSILLSPVLVRTWRDWNRKT